MKKIGCVLASTLLLTHSLPIFAGIFSDSMPSTIKATVNFDWQKPDAPFNSQPIHASNTLTLNANQLSYTLVAATTKIADGMYPVTLALLVKPVDVTADQIGLQFQLIKYAFTTPENNAKYTALVSQPRLVLKNGQTGSMDFPESAMKVSATATWS